MVRNLPSGLGEKMSRYARLLCTLAARRTHTVSFLRFMSAYLYSYCAIGLTGETERSWSSSPAYDISTIRFFSVP